MTFFGHSSKWAVRRRAYAYRGLPLQTQKSQRNTEMQVGTWEAIDKRCSCLYLCVFFCLQNAVKDAQVTQVLKNSKLLYLQVLLSKQHKLVRLLVLHPFLLPNWSSEHRCLLSMTGQQGEFRARESVVSVP